MAPRMAPRFNDIQCRSLISLQLSSKTQTRTRTLHSSSSHDPAYLFQVSRVPSLTRKPISSPPLHHHSKRFFHPSIIPQKQQGTSIFGKTHNSTNLQPTNPSQLLSSLDVLSSVQTPSSSVETVYADGFLLNNGLVIRTTPEDGYWGGVFLLNNQAFRWNAVDLRDGLERDKMNELLGKGVLELSEECWGVLDVVWPKPDLLIVGTGTKTLLLHPNSKKKLQDLGIRVDVMDTHNAAAEYNLLATERPGGQVAAALMVVRFGK